MCLFDVSLAIERNRIRTEHSIVSHICYIANSHTIFFLHFSVSFHLRCAHKCIEYLKNVTYHKTVLKFPSDEDLSGAAIALIRLQDTYNLDTASVARGELNGVQYR